MSNDMGLGLTIIAFRRLALLRDPDLEKDITEASTRAGEILDQQLAQARERPEGQRLIGGEWARFLVDNQSRVDFYLRNGGQLDLINSVEARAFLARSREQGA